MSQETEERAETTGADEPDPRRWRILGVTLVVGFMVLLDVTIVNVAIPSIRTGLDTSAGAVQWVVSGYALALGLMLVIGGRLGDAHGRRAIMLLGLGGFVVASAAAGPRPIDERWHCAPQPQKIAPLHHSGCGRGSSPAGSIAS